MSLRTRITLATAATVALMAALVSIVVFTTVRADLRGRVDASLKARLPVVSEAIAVSGVADPNGGLVAVGPPSVVREPGVTSFAVPAPELGGAAGYVQFVGSDSAALNANADPGGGAIPVTAADREVASGAVGAFLSERTVDGNDVRVFSAPLAPGLSVLVARPLGETDATLRRLIFLLLAIGGAATLGGAGIARLVAGRVIAPVRRLSEAADHVAQTRDLSRRVVVESGDELGRVATDFNTMLDALEGSEFAQRRLVADASHELRTPLTSIRTNLEVLGSRPDLPAAERSQILDDVNAEVVELSELLTGVVALAQGDRPESARVEVRLDDLAREAVARA